MIAVRDTIRLRIIVDREPSRRRGQVLCERRITIPRDVLGKVAVVVELRQAAGGARA